MHTMKTEISEIIINFGQTVTTLKHLRNMNVNESMSGRSRENSWLCYLRREWILASVSTRRRIVALIRTVLSSSWRFVCIDPRQAVFPMGRKVAVISSYNAKGLAPAIDFTLRMHLCGCANNRYDALFVAPPLTLHKQIDYVILTLTFACDCMCFDDSYELITCFQIKNERSEVRCLLLFLRFNCRRAT